MSFKGKATTVVSVCAIFLLLAGIAPAFAATGSTARIKPGPLTINAPGVVNDFTAGGPVTLSGDIQTLNATLGNWSISDATGSGKGWNVTVQASQLTEVLPDGSAGSLTLPLGSIALSGTRTIAAKNGSSTPVSPTGGPLLQNMKSVVDAATPVKIIDTQHNYGLGTYNVTEPVNGLTLTLQPKDTLLDAVNYPNGATPFSTTLTFTVATGP